jgi:hypothetical protein
MPRKLLGEAVAFAIKNGMSKATKAFNDTKGAFVHDDLYVFCGQSRHRAI